MRILIPLIGLERIAQEAHVPIRRLRQCLKEINNFLPATHFSHLRRHNGEQLNIEDTFLIDTDPEVDPEEQAMQSELRNLVLETLNS